MITKSVVLVDDHELVRAGIRSLLDSLTKVKVIAESGDGHEALKLVQELKPDILILDITIPNLNGLELTQRIKKLDLPTKILILSMHASSEYVASALSSGAAGYLIKDSALAELSMAIDSIIQNRSYVSQSIDMEVVKTLQDKGSPELETLSFLTPRQRQILQLIAEGKSTRDISEHLSVSIKTVETHRIHLMNRVGIKDIAGLVRFAIRHNLVDLE